MSSVCLCTSATGDQVFFLYSSGTCHTSDMWLESCKSLWLKALNTVKGQEHRLIEPSEAQAL
jgi:hypothetical protein